MLRICGSVDTNWDLTSKVNRIYVTTNVEVLLEHQVSVHMESCREIAKTGLENGKTEKHLIHLSCMVTSPSYLSSRQYLAPGAGVPTFGQSRAKTGAS